MLSKFIDHFGYNVAQKCAMCCNGTTETNATIVINRSERWKCVMENVHCMHAPNKIHFVNNNH